MDITVIVWMFMLGCAIAVLTVFYNNRFLGKFVRALIDIEATSPENAINIEELDVKITPFVSRALKSGGSLSEIVFNTEDGKYYIAPERVSLAKAKYRSKDATILFIIISLVILVLAAVALTYIFPESVESFSKTLNELFA